MLKQPLQRPRPIFKLVWNLCGRIGWRSATMASQPEKLRQWAQTKQLSVCRLCRIAHARKDTGTCHLCKIPFQNHIKKAVFGAWNGGGHGAVRVALHFTGLTCGPRLYLLFSGFQASDNTSKAEARGGETGETCFWLIHDESFSCCVW